MEDRQLIEVHDATVIEVYDQHYGWKKISLFQRIIYFIKSFF